MSGYKNYPAFILQALSKHPVQALHPYKTWSLPVAVTDELQGKEPDVRLGEGDENEVLDGGP